MQRDKNLLFIPIYQNINMIDDNTSKDNPLTVVDSNIKKISIKTMLIQNNKNYNLGASQLAFKYALEKDVKYLTVLYKDDINYINKGIK